MPDRSKISSLAMIVLFVLAVLFLVIFYLGKVVPGTEGTPIEEPLITDEIIVLAYAYFGMALFAVVVFSFFEFLRKPKNAKGLLIAAVAFLSIFGLSYLLATGKVIPGFNNPSNIEPTLRLVDTGLKAAYAFIALAVTGVIFTEIRGMLKSN